MNKFITAMLEKYSLTKEMVTSMPTKMLEMGAGKNKSVLTATAYYYTCKCGVLELFGFIDKCKGECRSCSGFTKS